MSQKVKIKKLIQKIIITTIALAAIIAAIGSMYNNSAYAQTDNSGSGSTDNSGSSGTASTDNSGSSGSTDNSGGTTSTPSTDNTKSTDNTQPTTQTNQPSTEQPKKADTCNAGCQAAKGALVGICQGIAPAPYGIVCPLLGLNGHVVKDHHHHN